VAVADDMGVSSNTNTAVTQSGESELKMQAEPDIREEGTVGDLQPVRAALENYGPAPELTNEVWLNGNQPLRLADLRGNVVLIDMWTFG
jgi:hypothetical protein